jgi:hypothetical protein
VLYTCVLWKLLGKYFSALFHLFFRFFFCVNRPDCVFREVRTVLLYVRTVILVVRTIWLIRPDVNSSSPDERVFVISTWHYIWTSLKFCPDGEPCRVKSHSPSAATFSFTPFGSFCRVVHLFCAFYAKFSSARVILAIYLHPRYVFNTLLLIFFKFLCLK